MSQSVYPEVANGGSWGVRGYDSVWEIVMDGKEIDIFGWIHAGGEARGDLPLARMERLVSLLADEVGSLHWEARGWVERPIGGDEAMMLQVRASARPLMTCSNCLEPVAVDLVCDRILRIVADEAVAERLDELDPEIDVIAGSRHFDLLELIEDEAILALPPLARHDQCEAPGRLRDEEDRAPEEPTGALAALASLIKGGGSGVQ